MTRRTVLEEATIGLKCIAGYEVRCDTCPYRPGSNKCRQRAAHDAFQILTIIKGALDLMVRPALDMDNEHKIVKEAEPDE